MRARDFSKELKRGFAFTGTSEPDGESRKRLANALIEFACQVREGEVAIQSVESRETATLDDFVISTLTIVYSAAKP